jgi:hypothetical protein
MLKLYKKFMADTDGNHNISMMHCLDICYLSKIAEPTQSLDVIAQSSIISDEEIMNK